VGPFDSLSLATVAGPVAPSLGYGTEGPEVHGSFRWALLGDGTSPTSASPDGVYLASLRLSSTQAGLTPSDEYFFVLNKNAPWTTVAGAVNSLGISPALQQWVVPEPGTLFMAICAVAGLSGFGARTRRRGAC
jgi:PEP-CTERM motif